MPSTTKPIDLTDTYWNSLSAEHQALYALVRPLTKATYEVDVNATQVDRFLEQQAEDMATMGGSLELDPDFQRGHVWTMEQRVAYLESLIRGCAPRTILFNCPGYSRGGTPGDLPTHTFQCIDGLQRLTSVRMFMAEEFGVFGGIKRSALVGSPFDLRRYTLKFAVYEFSRRVDILQFYLDLNTAGTAHSAAEIERVRHLLAAAQADAVQNA